MSGINPDETAPVAMGKVILALLTWTDGETRNLELAEETVRALPLKTLRRMANNMEVVVALARRVIEDRSETKVRP